jgi:hypothetical protein
MKIYLSFHVSSFRTLCWFPASFYLQRIARGVPRTCGNTRIYFIRIVAVLNPGSWQKLPTPPRSATAAGRWPFGTAYDTSSQLDVVCGMSLETPMHHSVALRYVTSRSPWQLAPVLIGRRRFHRRRHLAQRLRMQSKQQQQQQSTDRPTV